jgi:membrane-associated protease RseP (regulator of RpoE activity)
MPAVPAIPAMPAMSFDVPEMHVRTSWMGLTVETLSPQLGEYFGVRNGEGVLVSSVAKGSPADKAGLRAGDVIVRVEKERINGRGDWRSAMRTHRNGKVTLGVFRDRREQSITLVLPEDRGDNSFRIDAPDFDVEAFKLEMERLKPELMRASAEAARLSSAEVQRALRQARIEMEREMKRMNVEIEKERKDAEKAQKEAQKNNTQ